MNEDVLKNIQSEFRLWGVKPRVDYTNSGHIRLTWNATPDKPERMTIIPKTGSDWRGWMNARADIRRLFKQDGLNLKQECAKPKPVLAKALAIPEPVERDIDQIKLLRAEVGDLSELVLELAATITDLKAIIGAPPAPPIQPELPVATPVMVSAKPSMRIKAIDFVSENWSSTDALARDMNLTPMFAYRKLYYLVTRDKVELCNGNWRKKPQQKPEEKNVVAAFSKTQTRRRHAAHN